MSNLNNIIGHNTPGRDHFFYRSGIPSYSCGSYHNTNVIQRWIDSITGIGIGIGIGRAFFGSRKGKKEAQKSQRSGL